MMDSSLQFVLSLMSNLFVAISVILLWLQTREMRKQIQSSTYQTIVQTFDNFSQTVMQHPQLAQVLFGTQCSLDDVKAEWLVTMRLDWFESIIIQKHRYRALSDDIFGHWMRVLEYELSMPFIRNIWERYGTLYHPLLQKEVQRILSCREQMAREGSPELDAGFSDNGLKKNAERETKAPAGGV